VDEISAELLEEVGRDEIAALGGGRVIDTAKAIAAARGGRAMAVPTTLSGAEMTGIHRLPTGVDAPRVRPAVVVCDPALAASQPVAELAASALNGLGHVAEAPCTPKANPVATLAALRGGELLLRAFDGPEPDRNALALGALLAGYAIDSAHYGLHHVLSQTLVRLAGVGHGPANAVMLSHTLGALEWRFPAQHAALAMALGEDPAETAARLCRITGARRLRDLGVEPDDLPRCADAAAGRPELDLTPPRADRAELLAIYEHAY
jgi:alcohol dehydrogenase class IV